MTPTSLTRKTSPIIISLPKLYECDDKGVMDKAIDLVKGKVEEERLD